MVMAKQFELRGVSELALLVSDGERLGDIIDADPILGYQILQIIPPSESGRKPDDQVLIIIEPGGRTPIVKLAADKVVNARAVQGKGWAIAYSEQKGWWATQLDATLPLEGIQKYGQSDCYGFAADIDLGLVVRDIIPDFHPSDEISPSNIVSEGYLAISSLARAVLDT